MNLKSFIKYTIARYKKQQKEERLKADKKEIARRFNNMYTYKYPYTKDMGHFDEAGGWGKFIEKGYAWMCPECNKIHYPFEYSHISGLQYPSCCNTFKGYRSFDDIEYER